MIDKNYYLPTVDYTAFKIVKFYYLLLEYKDIINQLLKNNNKSLNIVFT